MILYMFRASHAYLQDDAYLQYLVSSRSVCSIQSVRIPDTANIQCPPEDEHVMLEICRGSRYNIIIE
jgi:hypothetical protein